MAGRGVTSQGPLRVKREGRGGRRLVGVKSGPVRAQGLRTRPTSSRPPALPRWFSSPQAQIPVPREMRVFWPSQVNSKDGFWQVLCYQFGMFYGPLILVTPTRPRKQGFPFGPSRCIYLAHCVQVLHMPERWHPPGSVELASTGLQYNAVSFIHSLIQQTY